MLGISQGLQPLCSFYYGKKDIVSVNSLLNMSLKAIKKSSVIAFLIVIIFSKLIVAIFIDKSEVELFNYTVTTLRVSSIAYLIMGYNIIVSGYCASIEKLCA